MWTIIDGIRNWLREHRSLSYWEKEELTQEWYELLFQIISVCQSQKDAWFSEWERLVREDRPRPWCRERFYAGKMDKLAKALAVGTHLYVSVTEGSASNVTITAKSLKCGDYVVASMQYGV